MRFGVFALLLLAVPAFAGLVTNGTFDNGCAGWYYGGYTNFCDTSSGNPNPALVLNDSPGAVPQATQSISGLTFGQQYTITLDARTWYNCCNDPTVPGAGVAIDGHQFDFLVNNRQPWTNYTFQFTYAGGSNVLVLTSQRNYTDSDAEFDNVDILADGAAVPEPGTWLTLASALGIVAVLRGRR
jgi:hypothetical protein